MVTVLDVVRHRVLHGGHEIAFVDRASGAVSVQRFWDDVSAMATRLRVRVERGRRVLVVGRCSYASVVAEMGAWLAGASTIGADPAWPLSAMKDTIARFRVEAVVMTDVSDNAERAAGTHLPIIRGDAHTSSSPPGEPASPSIDTNAEAFLVFSSGTTGSPRAVRYQHGQLLLASKAMLARVGPRTRSLRSSIAWLPIYNLTAKVAIAANLCAGVVTHFEEDPRKIAQAIKESSPDYVVVVPRFLEKVHANLARAAAHDRKLRPLFRPGAPSHFERAALPSLFAPLRRRIFGKRLRFIVCGSAPLRPDVRFMLSRLGVTVLDTYGVSESIVPIAARQHGVGMTPFLQNDVRIDDDGEVLVRGPGVFDGYVGEEPRPTTFTSDGFYRTGDIGELTPSGELLLRGRKDDMFKTSTGVKIAPAAVEATYAQARYVEDVVVFGAGRPFPVAIVTVDIDAATSVLGERYRPSDPQHRARVTRLVEDELATVGASLPKHLRVGAFGILRRSLSVRLGELTPSGKARRAAIAERHGELIDSLYEATACPKVSS